MSFVRGRGLSKSLYFTIYFVLIISKGNYLVLLGLRTFNVVY